MAVVVALLVGACGPAGAPPAGDRAKEAVQVGHPVFHFEIPVTDMARAVAFYEDVFDVALRQERVDGYPMAFFPRSDGAPGASGALAMGDVYRPTKEGVILYFDVPDIDATLARAKARGARVLYPKKDIGAGGFVAEIEDSEGNRIALSEVRG